MKCRILLSRGRRRATRGEAAVEQQHRLPAWLMVYTICSSDSRGLAVCSTAPMPGTAKNSS